VKSTEYIFVTLLLALVAVGNAWAVIGTRVPETSPAEAEEAALDRLAAMELTYRARIEAAHAEFRGLLAAQKYQEAEKKYMEMEGIGDEITSKYLEYIADHPESAVAYNQLGLLSYDLRRPEPAREYWERAIELKPDFAEAHNNLGTYYGHFGEPKKAILQYKKAIELKSKKAVFHLNLATEYFTSRKHAMELFGWDLPHTFEEILNEHRLARDLEPHNYDYGKQYAETFYGAKFFEVEPDWDEALRGWERCLETDLTDVNRDFVFFSIARIHLNRGDKDRAREMLTKVGPLKGSGQFGVLWRRLEDLEAATRGLRAASD